MQASSRGKQFVIDHRIVTVAVAIVVLIAVAGGAALLTTTRTTQGSDARTVADTQQRQLRIDRQDYTEWSLLRAVRMSQSDLDRAARLEANYEARIAHRDALEAQASDCTQWTAFPRHAGFITPATDGIETAVWTYRPGQPGFTEP